MRWLLAFASALLLGGCDAPVRDDTETFKNTSAKPALYEATSPEGQRAFLFGTAHALPNGIDWFTPTIRQAFDEADVLVVEIADLDDTQASIDTFRARAFSDGLPPLLERVPAADRPLLEDLLDRSSTGAEDYAGMDSWAVAMVLAGYTRIGVPENGVDRALLKRGKPVVALESFAQQYDLFDRLSDKEQSDLLVAMARESQESSDTALLRAWIEGDVESLEKDANEGMMGFPELREKLQLDRNRAWIGPIVALLDEGRTPFVAVGAAHVVGADGLVAMLEQRGYSARRIQ